MLYQRTIYNICNSSKTSDEIKQRLKEKSIPFEEYKDERGVFNLDGELIGRVAFMIDLGKVDEECYKEDYYGYNIIEMNKPFTYFFYSKIET